MDHKRQDRSRKTSSSKNCFRESLTAYRETYANIQIQISINIGVQAHYLKTGKNIEIRVEAVRVEFVYSIICNTKMKDRIAKFV